MTSNAGLRGLWVCNGNISQVSQNSTQGNSPAFTNTFTYDELDRLKDAQSTITGGGSGSLFPREQYSFDTLSRMTTRILGTATPTTYQYTDSAHVDAPTGYGTNTYSYDANGNQTGGTVLGVSQSRTFDPENRVSQVITGTYTTSFVYDANGQRLIKSVACTGICLGGGGSSTTRTLYIGNLYEETILGNGSPGLTPYISYYSLGGKLVGMRRANQSGSNGQYRIVGDHLGSTTLVVDTANPPNVVQRQYSKPYGETAWQYTISSSLTGVNYTGQRLDTDSGLMYFGARFYDPILSYFVSADTIVPDASVVVAYNRFAYTYNSPLNRRDPTGHCSSDVQSTNDLDCSVETFDQWDADTRLAWLAAFSKFMHLGDMFNSIAGVISYFRDSQIERLNETNGKSWASLADAGVLFAIQAGGRLANHMQIAFNGDRTETSLLQKAAGLWAATFSAYHSSNGDFGGINILGASIDVGFGTPLLSIYGMAEQAGEFFGTQYADDSHRGYMNDGEAVMMTVFKLGSDRVRQAQIAGIMTPLTDPKNAYAPYLTAMKTEEEVRKNILPGIHGVEAAVKAAENDAVIRAAWDPLP